MKNRYFWGTPHTDTDVNAFEAAIRERAVDVAAGKFAAAAAADDALELLARRSSSLLQFNALLAAVTLLFAAKTAAPAGLFLQLSHWGFVLALLSCILVLPNLALVWASDARNIQRSPREAYLFAMSIYKMRAARYTFAIVFSFLAIALALLSITQLG